MESVHFAGLFQSESAQCEPLDDDVRGFIIGRSEDPSDALEVDPHGVRSDPPMLREGTPTWRHLDLSDWYCM